jgi:hypothetical protein
MLLLMGMACVLTSGCKSTVTNYDYGGLLAPALATGAGATAWAFTKDESDTVKYAAIGGAAAGTYIVSAAGRALLIADMEKESAKGYVAGMEDTNYRLRHIRDNIKTNEEAKRKSSTTRYYTFPGAQVREGVNYVPHEVKVRMEE